MKVFEERSVICSLYVGREKWDVEVVRVDSLKKEEIAANRAHNQTIGNFDPENELPTEPLIALQANSSSGKRIELYWSPETKVLGPNVSQSGWNRRHFNNVKSHLFQWSVRV